jgi:hypothetical protein
LQRYSQEPSYGKNKDAPVLMNGSRKCGINTQWNFTQPWRWMKSYYVEVNGWNWTTSFWARLTSFRRPNSCSSSYVDFRLKANAAMLLDLGHVRRGEHIWEVWGWVEYPKHESIWYPHSRGTI